MTAWHVVSRSVPPVGKVLLVAVENANRFQYGLGEWTLAGEYFDYSHTLCDPTHWRELPDAPQPLTRLFE